MGFKLVLQLFRIWKNMF